MKVWSILNNESVEWKFRYKAMDAFSMELKYGIWKYGVLNNENM